MIITATDQIVDRTVGTNIGDFTGGGNLAAAFDGTTNQAIAAAASKATATFGYVGKSLVDPAAAITRAVVIGTSDQGYVSGANPTITIDLYAKSGAAPASSTDGTLIGTTSFTDTADEHSTPREVDSTVPLNGAAHVWVRVSQSGAAATMAVSEVSFYRAWSVSVPQYYNADNPIIGYDNHLTTALVSSDSADPNFPATNLANPSTALVWKSIITSTQYVTFVTSALSASDYVAVMGHNFADIAAQISIEIQPFATTDPFVSLIAPVQLNDNRPAIFRFPSQTTKGIRIKIASASANPQASVVYIGSMLVLPWRIYVGHAPINLNRVTNFSVGMSDGGQYLGKIALGEKLKTSVTLPNLDPIFYRASIDPFIDAAQTIPFFWGWRPFTYPAETAYGWLTNVPAPSNQRPNGMMSVALELDATE